MRVAFICFVLQVVNIYRALRAPVEAKGHLDVDLHSDRLAILASGFESPLAHSFDRFFIEAFAQRARDPDVTSVTVWVHNQP